MFDIVGKSSSLYTKSIWLELGLLRVWGLRFGLGSGLGSGQGLGLEFGSRFGFGLGFGLWLGLGPGFGLVKFVFELGLVSRVRVS